VELFYVAFLGACFIAAFCDFLVFKIPNEVLLFALTLFILKILFFQPIKDLVWPLIIFATVLCATFPLYLFKWIGAGDAKFIAVASLWASEQHLAIFFIAMSIAGGALALIYLKYHFLIFGWQQTLLTKVGSLPILKNFLPLKSLSDDSKRTQRQEKIVIPYGVAVFIGIVLVFYIGK
jgi:prepilin peptidase CpaA